MAPDPQHREQESYGLEVVVSTWHIAKLHNNAQPEGLPTDLLTKHSALFYLVDRVVCDTYGLRGELKWNDYWLSAKVFEKLKEHGLLHEVDLHGEPYVPLGFWDQLKASEIGRSALNRMDDIGPRLDRTNPRQIPGVDPMLLALNRSLFLNLRIPDNWLPYYQTDAHLRADPTRQVDLVGLPGGSTTEMRWRAQRISRLLELVEKYLPDPQLLPPMEDPVQRGALTRLTNQEKPHLYKVIYGAMSHGEFESIRRDRRFASWDKLVDTEIREQIAHENIERLRTIREQTKDLRSELQRTVVRIADGEIPMREAAALLTSQVSQLEQHVSGTLPRPYRLLRFVATELPAELIEFFLTQAWPGYPQLGPFGIVWALHHKFVKPTLDRTELKYVQPRIRRLRRQMARPDYPWGTLNQDLTDILGKGFELNPRG